MANPDFQNEHIDGRYEVLDILGEGAFGKTLLAREIDEDFRVAIKTLHPARAGDLKSFEMFEREAKVLGNLRHQGIPAILESFHTDWAGVKTGFLVMEYVEGPTLDELINGQHSFSTEDILTLFLDLAGIVEYLHGRAPSILHRDIKPSNVILRNGSPVLVDFGAVRNVFRAPDESGSTVVGTYGYMPYEQYMGQATPSSDLYALGATMLHVVTGRQPADFLSDQGRLEVPQHIPGGDRVRSVLIGLLAPAPADRIQSAAALRRALLGADATSAETNLPVPRPSNAPSLPDPEHLLSDLPPAPRDLEGDALAMYKRNIPSTWLLMGTTKRLGEAPSKAALGLYALASVVSIGVLPVVYWIMGATHRHRLKPFFLNGKPASARIQSIDASSTASGLRVARVSYEFHADGRARRGADNVFVSIVERWREGDLIPVLYIAERDYESVIVSNP